MLRHLATPPALWSPLFASLGFNEVLPVFEVVLAKGWKELNRDLSFLLEATKGLAQCNLCLYVSFKEGVSQAAWQPWSWLCRNPVTGW